MTILLAVLLLALCGVAIAAAARGYAQPRAHALSRVRDIEIYGFNAEEAAPERARRPSFVLLLGARVGQLLDVGWMQRYEGWMRRQLIAAAMYKVAARTVIGLQLVGALVLGALTGLAGVADALITNLGLAVVAAGLAWLAPLVFVHGQARRRLDQIDRQTPDLIDMLVVTLEAGLGFGASMNAASARMPSPIGDEVRLTMQEQRMGLAMTEALTNTLQRVDTPNMSAFVRSVVQGQNLGVSMGVVMRNLAVDMRVRRRQAAEERAHKAPVKMLFPLIFLMFPALGIVILGPALFEITEKLGGTVVK